MLTIYYKLLGESIIRHKEWHVGEPNPIPHNGINSIISIQADGHEYDYIAKQYYIPSGKTVTIPCANVKVMRWFGDIAKTIVANI